MFSIQPKDTFPPTAALTHGRHVLERVDDTLGIAVVEDEIESLGWPLTFHVQRMRCIYCFEPMVETHTLWPLLGAHVMARRVDILLFHGAEEPVREAVESYDCCTAGWSGWEEGERIIEVASSESIVGRVGIEHGK